MGVYDPYTPLDEKVLSADRRDMLGTPAAVPKFTLHREKADAIDADEDVPTSLSAGMNMHGYDEAVIQVVPKAGTAISPNIEVLQWSESAGTFVSFVSAKTASAPAVLTPFVYQCEVFGAIIWVRIAGTMTDDDQVEVLVAGAITGKKE